MKSKLYDVDNGRFSKILDTLDIDDVCFECAYFNKAKTKRYRCAVLGITDVPAKRKCQRCQREEYKDMHCLGGEPPGVC